MALNDCLEADVVTLMLSSCVQVSSEIKWRGLHQLNEHAMDDITGQ